MMPGRVEPEPAALDLVWLDALTDDLESLADRLARLADEARAARERGIDRTARFKVMSTASLVAEWLSYGRPEEAPETLLAELWRRANSHQPDSGPGLALLWRAIDHRWGSIAARQTR
jgi:hypothetical protein